MTKSKAYYQAYLVIHCLSNEEYSLIPKDLLDEIEEKMEIDDSIQVDRTIPLEKQPIDEKTYDILDKVIRAIERAYGKDAIDNPGKYAKDVPPKEDINTSIVDDSFTIEIDDSYSKPQIKEEKSSKNKRFEDKELELREENFRLQEIIGALEIETKKIEEAKKLFYDYKEIVNKKDELIRKYEIENEHLRQTNEELLAMLNRIPKFLKKIFKVDDLLK